MVHLEVRAVEVCYSQDRRMYGDSHQFVGEGVHGGATYANAVLDEESG